MSNFTMIWVFLVWSLKPYRLLKSKQIHNLWHLTFITTIWAIWTTRCKDIFEDVRPRHHGCMDMILELVSEAKNFKLCMMHSIEDLAIYR